jgi:hypothetical protein
LILFGGIKLFTLKLKGFRFEGEAVILVEEVEQLSIDLKNDYVDKIQALISERDTYQLGEDIIEVISNRDIEGNILFLWGKAETIDCGVLFSKNENLKIHGVWPENFLEAITKDLDIFKSLLYRLVKTPEFFEEVKMFNYNKPVIVEKEEVEEDKEIEVKDREKTLTEKPRIPKKPEIANKKGEAEGEYVIPEQPYKKKITTKVSIDFNTTKPAAEPEPIIPDVVPEAYGESLLTEIEDIASSFTLDKSDEGEDEVEFWDTCPFCFTRLSENTIKLLKAGLSTFCPNEKCRKLIKREFMVKRGK